MALSSATGSLGVGLTTKVASLTTSVANRIALNAAGNAVLGASDRVVRNALAGNCLGDNVLTTALVGGALGAAGEAATIAAPRVIGNLSGVLGGVDDAGKGTGRYSKIGEAGGIANQLVPGLTTGREMSQLPGLFHSKRCNFMVLSSPR